MGRRPRQQPSINIVYRDAKGNKKWTGPIELDLGDGIGRVMEFCRKWSKDNPTFKFVCVQIEPGIRK